MTELILSHRRVVAPGAEPSRTMLMLHGVFGTGQNLSTVARGLVARHPEWAFELVDLRAHGASRGFPPPHDLSAAATDLERLERAIGGVDGVVGHSFGGKVALAWMERRKRAGRAPLAAAAILDSMPGAYDGQADLAPSSAARVLEALEALPSLLPSREAFREHLEARGYDRPTIDWLAMNLSGREGGFGLRIDLSAIRSLLADYFATDLWRVLDEPGAAERVALVIGGRSPAFGPAAIERARLAASRNVSLEVVVLENAGHWVHVDDLGGLIHAISAILVGTGRAVR
ncbi:MAG: alpha/beta hydrolase [Polyangiaceae bacterium]